MSSRRLYQPVTTADRWPHRSNTYSGVQVTWLKDDPPASPADDRRYRDLIAGYVHVAGDEDACYARGLLDELFTASEAELLAGYLQRSYGEAVTLVERPLPLNVFSPDGSVYMPYSACPVGGGHDFYLLFKTDGYDLPFRVVGYYDLRF